MPIQKIFRVGFVPVFVRRYETIPLGLTDYLTDAMKAYIAKYTN